MIRIRQEPLDVGAITRSVEEPGCGAVATFVGVVRDHNAGRRVKMVRYEAYESMALKKLEEVARILVERFGVHRVALEHRLGNLRVGEASVVLAVSSAHREEAFRAVREGMDILKSTVPIWKREFFADGEDAWVGE
jgi:molybdopterin synthase catalytic subunit